MRGDHAVRKPRKRSTRGTAPHARGPRDRDGDVRLHPGNSPACAGTTPPCGARASGPREQPRMRGDHQHPARRDHACHGNSPACAGTTTSTRGTTFSTREQPRMRGDHTVSSSTGGAAPGTAPHARGPREAAAAEITASGNSPACAGTTDFRTSLYRSSREQPRMRGDHDVIYLQVEDLVGTAPHARGPPQHPGPVGDSPGNSPACAGTTSPCGVLLSLVGEQPRMRGDHPLECCRIPLASGTAPHARGPPRGICGVSRWLGNSPACAGTTPPRSTTATTCGEQPRMRGDHQGTPAYRIVNLGTAPHARGPRNSDGVYAGGVGNSPACAGTTTACDWFKSRGREQPRMRGDHSPLAEKKERMAGTAPHARGPHDTTGPTELVSGNSPACAGTTEDRPCRSDA